MYALEFDLVTPPYNEVQAVSIQQINNLNHSKTQTANRLGFKLKDQEKFLLQLKKKIIFTIEKMVPSSRG